MLFKAKDISITRPVYTDDVAILTINGVDMVSFKTEEELRSFADEVCDNIGETDPDYPKTPTLVAGDIVEFIAGDYAPKMVVTNVTDNGTAADVIWFNSADQNFNSGRLQTVVLRLVK